MSKQHFVLKVICLTTTEHDPCASYGPNIEFIHDDVADFYMTGDHSMLATRVVRCIGCKDLRNVLHDSICFLLFNPFVASSFRDQCVRQMILGSGQGQPHAGAVASVAFLDKCELNGPAFATHAASGSKADAGGCTPLEIIESADERPSLQKGVPCVCFTLLRAAFSRLFRSGAPVAYWAKIWVWASASWCVS